MAQETTKEGFLLTNAALTRVGPIQYERSEIGLPGTGIVNIFRTRETMSHPKTLESLRTAPITNEHPEGGVRPDNFQRETIGFPVSMPTLNGDLVEGTLKFGDESAINDLRTGKKEISIGYDMDLRPSHRKGMDFDTVGWLEVNHSALVEKGRAGPRVRVKDTKACPTCVEGLDCVVTNHTDSQGDVEMTKDELVDAFKTALTDMGMHKMKDAQDRGFTDQQITDAAKGLADKLSPVIEDMKKMTATASAKDAKAKAEKQVKELEDKVRAEERARTQIIIDAMPLIPEGEREALRNADSKAIMVKALGDRLPNADSYDEATLHGALMIAAKDARENPEEGDGLPPGVSSTFEDKSTVSTVATGVKDARAKAIDAIYEQHDKQYEEAGGI